MEGESAGEAAVRAELGGEGLDWVEIGPKRLLLWLRIGISRVLGVRFGGGDGARGRFLDLGRVFLVDGEGFA